ncbi:MAG: hypothetical protein IH903_00745 [Proteobacteria bacterium]|nr:hypothetical protein [Pseudomonadota bacterium]
MHRPDRQGRAFATPTQAPPEASPRRERFRPRKRAVFPADRPVDTVDRWAKGFRRDVKRLIRQSPGSIAKRFLQVHAPNRLLGRGDEAGKLPRKPHQMKAEIAATGE